MKKATASKNRAKKHGWGQSTACIGYFGICSKNESTGDRRALPTIPRAYSKIHSPFQQRRNDTIQPQYNGGRPRTFTPEQRADIIELAQIPPKVLGMPLTHWSLSKLKEAAEKKGIVRSISIETIRCILEEVNITYQHTKTWKESNDPKFHTKKNKSNSSTQTHRKMDG